MIRSGFISSVLESVRREGDGAEADEGEGEDDEPAEGLSLGQDDDQDELDRVHGRVQPILYFWVKHKSSYLFSVGVYMAITFLDNTVIEVLVCIYISISNPDTEPLTDFRFLNLIYNPL